MCAHVWRAHVCRGGVCTRVPHASACMQAHVLRMFVTHVCACACGVCAVWLEGCFPLLATGDDAVVKTSVKVSSSTVSRPVCVTNHEQHDQNVWFTGSVRYADLRYGFVCLRDVLGRHADVGSWRGPWGCSRPPTSPDWRPLIRPFC